MLWRVSSLNKSSIEIPPTKNTVIDSYIFFEDKLSTENNIFENIDMKLTLESFIVYSKLLIEYLKNNEINKINCLSTILIKYVNKTNYDREHIIGVMCILECFAYLTEENKRILIEWLYMSINSLGKFTDSLIPEYFINKKFMMYYIENILKKIKERHYDNIANFMSLFMYNNMDKKITLFYHKIIIQSTENDEFKNIITLFYGLNKGCDISKMYSIYMKVDFFNFNNYFLYILDRLYGINKAQSIHIALKYVEYLLDNQNSNQVGIKQDHCLIACFGILNGFDLDISWDIFKKTECNVNIYLKSIDNYLKNILYNCEKVTLFEEERDAFLKNYTLEMNKLKNILLELYDITETENIYNTILTYKIFLNKFSNYRNVLKSILPKILMINIDIYLDLIKRTPKSIKDIDHLYNPYFTIAFSYIKRDVSKYLNIIKNEIINKQNSNIQNCFPLIITPIYIESAIYYTKYFSKFLELMFST